MTDKPCAAGCHLIIAVDGNQSYRPIVLEAHGALYFSARTFQWPNTAIHFAAAAIDSGSFKDWHNHQVLDEEGHS